MNKILELLRRLLVIILWICGGGLSVFLIVATLFMLGSVLGLYDGGLGKDAWKAIIGFPFLAVVTAGITFVLHLAINWIFQFAD